MATSYYIYIKNETNGGGGGGGFKPIKPPQQNDDNDESDLAVVGSAITKVASKFKALGVIGIIIAAAKIAVKTTEVVSSYMSKETGDYVFNRNLNNSLSTIKALTNPIQTTVSVINQEQQVRLTNQRMSEMRVLFGEKQQVRRV